MISNAKIENFYDQTGVCVNPKFAWCYDPDEKSFFQSAYRIVIQESGKKVFDSGKIYSGLTSNIYFKNLELKHGCKYTWDLLTWGNDGEVFSKSNLEFITGIDTFNGQWITFDKDKPFYARTGFNINKKIQYAIAYVCGLGHFKLFVNGEKVTDHELDPGWTDYNKSVQYVTFDITESIKEGSNAVGVSVGNGWYVGCKESHFYCADTYNAFSDHLPLICNIIIKYEDGTEEDIFTDTSWKVAKSATVYTNVYGSEGYDARLYPMGWNEAGFDDSAWHNAALAGAPKGKLLPQTQPPVFVKKVYDTVKVTHVNETTHIFDLGQNMSGMFEVTVSGQKGDTITITPVEKLKADGTIDKTVDTVLKYTLNGDGVESWKSEFSYSAGRWVQVEGAYYSDVPLEGKTAIHTVKGHFVTNSAEDVGAFYTDDERYNKINHIIVKAIESNLQSVHTDCPTIEKMGWLEASQLMAPSLCYNKNCRELLSKIARDAAEAQEKNGLVPTIAPTYLHFGGAFWDSPAWGSAVCIIPWLLYMYYGEIDTLRNNYSAMVRYADYLRSKENRMGMLTHGLGDWGIAPQTGESHANIETAIYYWDLCIIKSAAELFGYEGDKEYFEKECERVKANYNTLLQYNDVVGVFAYHPFTQANQAIALYMDLVPEDKKNDVIKAFKASLSSGRINSGEIGLPFIFRAACKYGLVNEVQTMIMQPEHKSYYRFVLMGETTLPEFWVDDARSRNHDMLGSVMEWFYSALGGISPALPGFEKIRIAPQLPDGLNETFASYKSVKGKIVSSWKKENGKTNFHFEIPGNTTAILILPNGEKMEVESGCHDFVI